MKPNAHTALAIAIVATVLASLAALLFIPIPEQNRDHVGLVLGALLAAFSGVVGYYFGSSQGSAAKNALIAGMSAAAPSLIRRAFPQSEAREVTDALADDGELPPDQRVRM